MKQIVVFSILLLSAMAATIGATLTTAIQPAYSQASHCYKAGETSGCVTPGQDPSFTRCENTNECTKVDITHRDASTVIGDIHKNCPPDPLCTATVEPPTPKHEN